MMSHAISKKLAYFCLFIIFALLIEIINFKLLGFGLVPEFNIFNLAFMLILGTIFLIIPAPEIQFAVQIVILIAQMAISVVNVNLMAITGEIFFWDMLALMEEGANALEGATNLLNFSSLWVYAAVTLMVFVAHYFTRKAIDRKPEKPYIKSTRNRETFIVSFVTAVILFVTGLWIQNAGYNQLTKDLDDQTEAEILSSDAYLYETMFQPESTLKNFGTYTYYVKGLSFYLGIDGNTESSGSLIENYLAEGQYETNDYTGISEGNNVIMILLESFEYFAISEEFTPTLYNLFYEDGVLLSNFYAKTKTDAAEGISLFGSYPATGSLFRNYQFNEHPTSLPNMLRNNTSLEKIISYHHNDGSFYNRDKSHEVFGFDNHVDLDEMDIEEAEDTWVNSDLDLFNDQVTAMIPDTDTFFTYITTFSMHGGYETRDAYKDEYEYFDSIDYHMEDTFFDEYLRTYIAGAMDLDQALEVMFDRLEATNHLDDTTVVLFADHFAYYYGLSYMVRGIDSRDETYIERYHIPALIYDTKLKAAMTANGETDVDKFTSAADLTPTVLNLLGIDYNPNWYVGADIFSTTQTVVISKSGGIFNDKFYTEDGEMVLSVADGVTIQDWYDFQEAMVATMKRREHLNLIYFIDYYGSLPDDLDTTLGTE